MWLSSVAAGWRDACVSVLAGGVTLGGVRSSHLLGQNQVTPNPPHTPPRITAGPPERLLSEPPFLHDAKGRLTKARKKGAGCRVSRSSPIVVGLPAHRL